MAHWRPRETTIEEATRAVGELVLHLQVGCVAKDIPWNGMPQFLVPAVPSSSG